MRALATEVFQFLLNELKGKNEGYEERFHEWNSRAQSDSRFRHQYYARRSSSANFGSERAWGTPPPTYDMKNPQPTEAKRWLRQAQCDLAASHNDENNTFVWACFKAHQVRNK